jgi:hypothetical protein
MPIEPEAVNKEINCSETIFLEAETAYEMMCCYLNVAVRIAFVSTVVIARANRQVCQNVTATRLKL